MSTEYDSLGSIIKRGDINPYHEVSTKISYEYNEDSSIHRTFTTLPYLGALFECDVFIDNSKHQIFRHYYLKK